jgi:uncharacterized protein YdeI (YjbR/CyaY-like superfamily)
MGTRDPRVDAYIANAAEFARPILEHLRAVVHAACPDVEETMKWRFPHFMYRGMLCSMAAFKQHCTFGFWKGALLFDGAGASADGGAESAMGQFGRITSLTELPSKRTLAGYVKRAMQLNEDGAAVSKPRRAPKPEAVVPDDLAQALARKQHRTARQTFEAFSPSHRREYIEWITEAKGEATRLKRLATTLEWLAEGKPRNWKYLRG